MNINLNTCIFIGKILTDVKLKVLNNGNETKCVTFQMFCDNRKAAMEKRPYNERVFDFVAYGKTAERLAKWFRKNNHILVECIASKQVWNDKDGNECSRIFFVVQSFRFIESVKKYRISTEMQHLLASDELDPDGEIADLNVPDDVWEEECPYDSSNEIPDDDEVNEDD